MLSRWDKKWQIWYIMKRELLLIIIITVTGGFLRFYNLDWGQGIFTHPDEYHIVTSVNQLNFPYQMHPDFFSYGTFTIYLIYFTKEVLESLNLLISPFLIGRFYSAFFSTLSIPIIYLISRQLLTIRYSLLATFTVATIPGLIQQAHFATPESTLIFFILLNLLCQLRFNSSKQVRYLFLAGVCLGLGLAVKVSSFLMIIPLIALVFLTPNSILQKVKYLFFSLTTACLFFFITAPFVILDYSAFKSNLDYEGGLAAGKFVVFYTRQFINTIPIIFQLEKIYPYALGPTLEIFGLTGLGVSSYFCIIKRDRKLFLLILTFGLFFFFNSFLFAKWTRFSSPTFPFFALFSALLIFHLSNFTGRKMTIIVLVTLLLLHLISVLSFLSIYQRMDVRQTATDWISQNIPPNSIILLEGGNMIDVPLTGNYQKLGLDFYQLEENKEVQTDLISSLVTSDYFIIQSRRVFINHQRLPDQFPITANFYNRLFASQLGFQEVKIFTSYPQLKIQGWKLEIPDEVGEETWSVFDHPVIRIYKKMIPKTKEEYELILQI